MPNERVFILVGSLARFIPPSDDDIRRLANVRNAGNDSVRPPTRIPLIYCTACGVSWLEGVIDPVDAAGHPEHYHTQRRRSLVVFIDGACPANGPAAFQASVGVYFGPESPNNISCLVDTNHPTNQLAEITAAVEAMRQVRTVIVPERRALLDASEDARYFLLVLVTDSSYLVECMCKHMRHWTFDEASKAYYNQKGIAIKNSDAFRTLNKEIRLLSLFGIQVEWCHVPREC